MYSIKLQDNSNTKHTQTHTHRKREMPNNAIIILYIVLSISQKYTHREINMLCLKAKKRVLADRK